mgnify:CR=1 FL=1
MSKETPDIIIGEVLGAHGQDGELRVRVLTEFPERFKCGAQLYIDGAPYTIQSSKHHRDTAILKLSGIDTPSQATLLRHKSLAIPENERHELPEGRYYHHDIIGLEVWTSAGTLIGRVSQILNTGGNDVYVVNDSGKEVLIPAVKDVVKEIDPAQGRITIEAIEGLLG